MMEFDIFSILNSGQYLIIWRIQFHFIIIRIPFQFLSPFSHSCHCHRFFFGSLVPSKYINTQNRDVHVHLDHLYRIPKYISPDEMRCEIHNSHILPERMEKRPRKKFVYVHDGIMNINLKCSPSSIEPK